jgi:hypothetical protein
MQQKITLSVIFAALVLFSSFIPGSFSRFQLYPTACDLYVQNNTNEELASANFISSLDNVTFFNIAPKGGTIGGRLQFENTDVVTITLAFSAPLSGNVIARIYNNGNTQVGAINIAKGDSGGDTRIYPVVADGILVRIYPN